VETGVHNAKYTGVRPSPERQKTPTTYLIGTSLDWKGYSCRDAKTKKQVGITPNQAQFQLIFQNNSYRKKISRESLVYHSLY
jgi:hypothetical protein